MHDLGLAISRVPPAQRTLAEKQRPSKGRLIEFVGPANVGKSTLLQQVLPFIKPDWFFEAHAKGLVGHISTDPADETYLKRLVDRRLENIMSSNMPLNRIAEIGQRVFEVARLGLVTKSAGIPRGFVMDDGLAHFFAEQITKENRDDTQRFFAQTAFVFLLPEEAFSPSVMRQQSQAQLKVYCDLKELLLSLQRPVLVLKRGEDNVEKLRTFIEHEAYRSI